MADSDIEALGGVRVQPSDQSDMVSDLGAVAVEPQETIGPSTISPWQRFKTGTIGRKFFGAPDIEKEAMAGGVSGSQMGVLEIPEAMLKMTSLGLPPVRKAVETVTEPAINLLPAAPRGILKGAREFALSVPLAPIPGVTGPKTALAALGVFGGQYLSELPDTYKQFKQAVSKGDVEGASKIAAEAGLGGALLAFGATHGIKELQKPKIEKGIADATRTLIEQRGGQPEYPQVEEGALPTETGRGNRPVGATPQPETPVAARPSAPPDTGVNALRPAVKLPTGDVVSEAPPASHAEILKDVGIPPKDIPHADPARGFVTKEDPQSLLSRKQAEKVAGVKGTAKAGGLDSQDLPAALSPKEIKSELVSRLEEAVSKAPSQADLPKEQQNILESLSRSELFEHRASSMRAAKEAGLEQQTIEIPDDGTFTVWNTKEALGEVLKRAKRLQTTPGGGPPEFRKTGISKEDREWIAKQQTAQPTVESVTPLEPQSGAPLVGLGGAAVTGEPAKPQLSQLTDATKTLAEQSKGSENLGRAFDLGASLSGAKDRVSQGLAGLQTAYQYAKQKFIGKPEWNDWKAMLGDRRLSLTESAANTRKWVKTATKAVPNEKTQEALSNYIDTGGNDSLLQQAANETKPAYKAGYERARNLSPEEKTLAANIKNYFDSRLQEAIDAGILEAGVEDYIHRIYEKDSPWKMGVLAELRSGIYTGKPALAKQRVYQYDFEAEKAGRKPIKSAIKRIAAYDLSLNKAMADRKAVKDMMEITMPDGRPMIDVGGQGVQVKDPEGVTEATLIKPKYRPSDEANPLNHRGDYKAFDYPALRKWKWVSSDANGKPIFLQGDVLVHPEAIPQLKVLFERSKVRQNPIGRALLGTSSAVKQTMLDLSGFHFVQIGVHGMEHLTFRPVKEIDFSNPDVRGLIRGGLVAGDTGAHELFSEGLTGSSLTRHIPGIGPILQRVNDALFNSFIPRLKVATGLHALERNRARFPNLTQDEVYHLTANEMNAAFGEQNYELLGRSKTTQDMLRLAVLAPDFLEARSRFVGQAGTVYGREQFRALATGAIFLYMTARIMNKLLDDEYHLEPKNAFNIVYKGRAYSLRTIQGDLLHLLTKRGQFFYSRLNPLFGRTAMEAVSGRDYFGRQRGTLDQLKDLATTIVPISLRGILNPREQKLWESFLNAFGITERRDTSTDTIYNLAAKFKRERGISEPGEFIYDRDKDPYRSIKLALAYETPEKAAQEMTVAIRDGKITYPQLFKYFQQYGKRPFTGSKKNDALFVKSLTTDQKKIYNDAITERQKMRENARIALTQFRQQLMRERALPAPEAQPEANPFAQ